MSDQIGRLRWTPLGAFGAEVSFDLNETMTDEELECFVRLYNTHDLLLFRGQSLSHARQLEVVGQLGPVTRVPEAQNYVSNEQTSILAQTMELAFHSDFAWAPQPIVAISLHALDVPEGETSTRFANASRAYARLPAALKTRLQQIDADMVAPVLQTMNRRGSDLTDADFPLHERRRVVGVNERTGRRFLLVNAMQTAGILDVPPEEGRALLQTLFEQIYAPDNQFEHFWRRGDFILWDNRNVQHARGDVTHVGRRVLQRVSIGPSLADQYKGVREIADYRQVNAKAS